MRRRAGIVKITPAARASPEEAAVCTMLFSRMFDSRKRRSTAIEITAAGMDDDTVIPANRPRYALAPASTAATTTERTTALTVISGTLNSAGMTGRGPAREAFDT